MLETSIHPTRQENEERYVRTKAAELVCPLASAFSLDSRARAVGT